LIYFFYYTSFRGRHFGAERFLKNFDISDVQISNKNETGATKDVKNPFLYELDFPMNNPKSIVERP